VSTVVHAVLSFAFLLVVFGLLERAFAARPQPVLRRETGTDALFFFGQYLVWGGLVIGGLTYVSHGLDLLPLAGLRAAVGSQPGWLQAIEVVLLGDVLVYWGHRLSHRWEVLWRFHRVHHTAETLDWLAAHREHPVDGLYTQLLVNLPGMLMGFPVETIAGVAAFRGMWGLFIHANVDLPLGPLKYVLGSPKLHHWHHDYDRGGEVNFANLMPILDVVFGTYAEPAGEPARFGVPDAGSRSYWGQLLEPLGLRRAAPRRDVLAGAGHTP
jgi:sterol desaturase/sphingolipid hydroxylase (fatty acid hydroxylase superfamily)